MSSIFFWITELMTKPDISHIIPLINQDVIVPTSFDSIKHILKAKHLPKYYEYIQDIVDFYNGTDSRLKLSPDTIVRVLRIYDQVYQIQSRDKISLSRLLILKRILHGLGDNEAEKINDIKSIEKIKQSSLKWAIIEPEIKHHFIKPICCKL